MEKKLFRVKVILYVLAENESEACVAATTARFDIFECTAHKAKYLDPGWETAIPYNSEDSHTCAEILASQPEAGLPALSIPTNFGRPALRVRAASSSVASAG